MLTISQLSQFLRDNQANIKIILHAHSFCKNPYLRLISFMGLS